jgi:hypothetical protein
MMIVATRSLSSAKLLLNEHSSAATGTGPTDKVNDTPLENISSTAEFLTQALKAVSARLVQDSPRFTKTGHGGRSSSNSHVATVFGCSGFIGSLLVNQLGRMQSRGCFNGASRTDSAVVVGKHGTEVVTPYRGEQDDIRHLKIMGDLGRIVPLVRDGAREHGEWRVN